MKTGIELIAAERAAQKWTPQHDDTHFCGELACAAAVYACPPIQRADNEISSQLWPDGWEQQDYDRKRELVVAGALIAAELDRLLRKEGNTEEAPEQVGEWAVVELMGHTRIAGRISEETRFGATLGRVDVPEGDGFVTCYFSGANIDRLTLVTEQVVRQSLQPTPPQRRPYGLPAGEVVYRDDDDLDPFADD